MGIENFKQPIILREGEGTVGRIDVIEKNKKEEIEAQIKKLEEALRLAEAKGDKEEIERIKAEIAITKDKLAELEGASL